MISVITKQAGWKLWTTINVATYMQSSSVATAHTKQLLVRTWQSTCYGTVGSSHTSVPHVIWNLKPEHSSISTYQSIPTRGRLSVQNALWVSSGNMPLKTTWSSTARTRITCAIYAGMQLPTGANWRTTAWSIPERPWSVPLRAALSRPLNNWTLNTICWHTQTINLMCAPCATRISRW